MLDEHTGVPEVAVDEHDKSLSDKGDVGFPWEVGATNAIAIAVTPQKFAQ